MSDIRAQIRRDAEFDRLLAETRFEGGETADFYLGSAMAKAYEMGKRHEAERGPAWHDAPTCPGWWVCVRERYGWVMVDVRDGSSPRFKARWFGPIPADEVKP